MISANKGILIVMLPPSNPFSAGIKQIAKRIAAMEAVKEIFNGSRI